MVTGNMPTLVRNKAKGHHISNKLAMESPVHSTGHTHSMTSNREEVSWSSSDGSTYYSDDGTSLEHQNSAESTDYSEDEVSLQQRKQTYRESRRRQDNNNVSYSTESYDAETDNQRSKEQKKTTSKTKERSQGKDAKKKNKLRLENVDSFSGIDLATGSEGVSAVAFLSTEDTAEVFCKAGIPNEITANKKLYEKVSAISSASTGDSSAESSYSSNSESDEESRRKGYKCGMYAATKTERPTVRSKASEVSTADTSVSMVDQHAVDLVSISYQDPVSSLECASTWDDLSLGSNTSGSDSVKKPRKHKTSKSPVQERESLTSHQLESRLSKMKEIKRKKSDLKTDERIRQLKAKIKSIQDLSATHRTVSSSEVESHLSCKIQSKAIQKRRAAEYENEQDDDKLGTDESLTNRFEEKQRNKSGDDRLDTGEQLTNRFEEKQRNKSGDDRLDTGERLTNRFEEKQRNKSGQAKRDYRISFEGEKSLVGTMIPVVEREEVSVLRFDTSARAVAQGDIEEGPFRSSKCEKRTSMSEHTKALRNSITEHTKVLLTSVQYKAITAYDHIVPIIARKRAEFLRKPRYEQILIVAIGSLFSIFIVLLFVMIAQ